VSSLWTPSGEHEVPRPGPGAGESTGQPPAGGAGGGSAGSAGGGGNAGGGAPPPTRPPGRPGDGEPTEEELREVARQLAAAPPEDVIANHCYGLFELAALHLSQQPPQLPQASMAIDAMGLIVEGLNTRLGTNLADLSEGLNQLRLAFVRISDMKAASEGGDSGS
jgi:hypothetical protein